MENSEYFGSASVRNLVRRFENQSDGSPRTNLTKFKSKSSSSIARPRVPLLPYTDEIPIAENNTIRNNSSPTATTFKERRSLFERPGAAFPLRRSTSTNLECLKLQEINEISKKTDDIVFKIKKSQKVGSSAYISYLNEIVELLIQIGEIDTFGNASVQQEKLATLQVLQKCYFQLKDKIQIFMDDGSNELEEVELLQIKDLIAKWEQITEKRLSETYRLRDRPPPPPTTPKPVHFITDIRYEEHPVVACVRPNVEPNDRSAIEIKPVKAESREDDLSYKALKVKDLMNVFQSAHSEERRSSSKESSPSPSRDIKNQPPFSPYKYVSYSELKRNESMKEDSLKAQPALQVSSYVGLLNSFSPKIDDDERPPAYEEAIRDPKIEESLQIKIQEIQDDIEIEMSNKVRSASPIQIEEYEEKYDDNLEKTEETISIIITKPEEQQEENILTNETETDEDDSENLTVPNELLISYQKALENEFISTNSDNETESTSIVESGQAKDEIVPIPNDRRITYEELSSLDPNALQAVNEVRVMNSIIVAYDQLLEENELKSIKNEPKPEDSTIPKDNISARNEIEEFRKESTVTHGELQDSNEIETNDATIGDAKIESYKIIQAERAFYSAEEVVGKDVKVGQLDVHDPICYLLVANDEPKEYISENSIWTVGEPEKRDPTNQFLINLPQDEQITTNENILTSKSENVVNQEEIFIVKNEPPENEIQETENNSNLDEYNDLKDTNSTIETHDQLLAENSVISIKNEENPNGEDIVTDDPICIKSKTFDIDVTPKEDNKEMEEGDELITFSEGFRNKAPEAIKNIEKEDNYEIIKNEENVFSLNKRTTEEDEETGDNKVETEIKEIIQAISKDGTQKTTNLKFEDPQNNNEVQIDRYMDIAVAEPRDAKIECYEFIQAERAFYSTAKPADKDIVEISQLETYVPISYLLVAVDEPGEDIPEDSTWTAGEPEKQDLLLINLSPPEHIVSQKEIFTVNNELPESKSPQANFNLDSLNWDEHNSNRTNSIIEFHDELLKENNLIVFKNEEEIQENGSTPKQRAIQLDTETSEHNVENDIKEKGNKEEIEITPKDDVQESAGHNLEIEEISDPQNNNEVETRTHKVTTNVTVVSSRKGVSDSIIASYDQLLEENGLKPLEYSNDNETVIRKVVTERVVLRKQESVKSRPEKQSNTTGLDNSVLDEYPSLYNNLKVTNSIVAAYDQLLEENNLKGSNQESIKPSTRYEDLKSEEPDLLKGDNETEDDVFRPSENLTDKKETPEEILIEGLQKPVEEETEKDETKLLQKFSFKKKQEEIQITSTEDLLENVELSCEPSRARGVTDSIIASYDLLLDENGLNQENVVIKNIPKEMVVMRRHQRNAELIGIESFDPLHSNHEEYPSLYNSVNPTNSIIAAYDQLLEENNLKSIKNEETLKTAKQTKEFADSEGTTKKLLNIETQVAEESDEDPIGIKSKTSEQKPLLQSTRK